ncbi:unnamed protein product, partial [Allacma fusca]
EFYGLAIVPIIYGIILIIPPITDYLLDQKNEEAEGTEAPPGLGHGPIIHFDTRLTLAVYVTIVVMGLVGVHTIQGFMGLVLFHASTKIVVEPLEASSKFRGYLIWSAVFLVFLLISLILYTSLIFHFLNWIIMSFLIVQIVFRALTMLFVHSCRVAIRRQFLHSEVPWINPSLPTATL